MKPKLQPPSCIPTSQILRYAPNPTGLTGPIKWTPAMGSSVEHNVVFGKNVGKLIPMCHPLDLPSSLGYASISIPCSDRTYRAGKLMITWTSLSVHIFEKISFSFGAYRRGKRTPLEHLSTVPLLWGRHTYRLVWLLSVKLFDVALAAASFKMLSWWVSIGVWLDVTEDSTST